jgi:hypothetical protein
MKMKKLTQTIVAKLTLTDFEIVDTKKLIFSLNDLMGSNTHS